VSTILYEVEVEVEVEVEGLCFVNGKKWQTYGCVRKQEVPQGRL